MIKINDIKPDFEILKLYLNGGISLNGLEPIFYSHFEKYNLEFNRTKFRKLLTDYKLVDHLSNIYAFAWYYSDSWLTYNENIKDFNKVGWPAQTYIELKELNDFLSKNQFDKLKLSTNIDQLTINSPYILSTLKIFINSLVVEEWEEWKHKENELEKEKKLRELFPKKQSYVKKFTETLSDIFHYLKNETYFKENIYQDTDIYNFIYEFCLVLGIDGLPSELRKYIN